MDSQSVRSEIREALGELQEYLSDKVAPLMVVDSIDLLIEEPAEITAAQIHAWATSQYAGPGTSVPVSDYFFHALKKIHLLGEYELVQAEPVHRFVYKLTQLLMPYCPPVDRDMLKQNVEKLGMADSKHSSPVEYLHRQAGSGAERPVASQGPAAAPGRPAVYSSGPVVGGPLGAGGGGGGVALTPEMARGLRNFGSLVDRVQRQFEGSSGPEPAGIDRELVTQLLSLAAINSQSGSDLERHMGQLEGLGVQSDPSFVFRELGQSLPDWVVPVTGAGHSAAYRSPAPVEAMHRIIALAEDPREGASRFREMVQAAIEQFNSGSLARAATMFDLADRIITEKKVDSSMVQVVREKSHESLDVESLRRYSENPEKHQLLARVLSFFKAFAALPLLEKLQFEEKRDQRRLWLALLKVIGADARSAAVDALERTLNEDTPDEYFLRNLIHLVRRVPPPEDSNMDIEVGLMSTLALPPTKLFLVKEAIACLGESKHDKAEQTLINLLGDYEQMLVRPKEALYASEELILALDRLVSALGRFGTLATARATAAHSLKKQPHLGNTMARIVDLGSQDLSGDPELVSRLIKALKAELPMRVLGMVFQRKHENVFFLLEALSGTRAPVVREILDALVRRFPQHDFGRTAAKILADLGAAPTTPEPSASSLTGDLELFGLPNLMQSLAGAEVSGVLTLREIDNETLGLIAWHKGRVVDAQCGKIRGSEAIYQLFEKPVPGSFSFVARRETAQDKVRAHNSLDVVGIVFEAMRRYDEYRQARAIVPDEITFRITGVNATTAPDEQDASLIRNLWGKVETGSTASQCEEALAVDSYRVRRLLAHWVQEGSIHPA